jgi:hypothetical protein
MDSSFFLGHLYNNYLYIKAAFNVPREKLSPRPLAAEARQSRGCFRPVLGTQTARFAYGCTKIYFMHIYNMNFISIQSKRNKYVTTY